MYAVRTLRPAAVAALLGLTAFAGPARAEPDKAVPDTVTWDVQRKTSPETVAELKALQARVRDVVAKVTPSTVGLIIPSTVPNQSAAGSGVIISPDGLVLTAAHVIGRPGREIFFVLPDGTKVKGKSLGVDAKADSGMAKITDAPPKTAKWAGAAAGKWPAAALGKGTGRAVGQWVVSLGHPGGPKPDRPPPVRVGRFANYDPDSISLRSDCTLVGGDSGGPLFDLDGKVVGIHSRIGAVLEQNLHVPADTFKDEWDKLAKGDRIGRLNRIKLGADLDPDEDAPTVAEVADGGLAQKAGLKAGDVVKVVDGVKVESAKDVDRAVETIDPDQREFDVEVRRGGKSETLTVTVRGGRPSDRFRKKGKGNNE